MRSPADFFGLSGLFEMKGSPIKVKFGKRAKNSDPAEKLWDASEKLTGLYWKDLFDEEKNSTA